jgi:hypothetical protein
LNVDCVQTQAIFLDNPIDTAISTFAYGLACVLEGASVAYGQQKFDDQVFKEARRACLNTCKQIYRKFDSYRLIAKFDVFLGCHIV